VPYYIGTDGDGINDADEGNVFGPLAPFGTTRFTMIANYDTQRRPWVVAGNTFGIDIHGVPWTNNSTLVSSWRGDQGKPGTLWL